MDKTKEILVKIEEILAYENNWDWDEHDEIDLEEKFGKQVEELGIVPFLGELYLNHHDDMITSKMITFCFVWKKIHMSDWISILNYIENNKYALYYFIPFCANFLKVDLTRYSLLVSFKNETLKKVIKDYFPKGMNLNTNDIWEAEHLEEANVDPKIFWNDRQNEFENLLKSM